MGEAVTLCRLDELSEKAIRRFEIKGREIMLVRDGEKLYALEDHCSHEDFPLSDGYAGNGTIVCPMHGASFDLETGEPLSLPAYEPVAVFPVRIQDGSVVVEFP